ncbi:winged helix-turn-helix domain-containing protein [Pantoea dispersa]|uniref:winged helix-turn-helix domain-containing protein n=1 Tax=Pantoea dispersa TaxID=59814 RepID=UPI0023AA0311|nr:winged helix-turn-helix domain-containing protein [Pantoea dispersa]WEA04820.1 winged helix-turn-helix domain-containing protein [Pantoea dispersa]
MSRKIIINSVVDFEPEKKRISGKKGTSSLSASAALCFELLIDNVGDLVTHDQFYDYAWRRFGMEPTSTSLYQNISALRKSLIKAGLQQDIIRTMPRRGFLLSPLTQINRTEPERIVVDDVNAKEMTMEDKKEKDDFINFNVVAEMEPSKTVLPLNSESHVVICRNSKVGWMLACLAGMVIGGVTYYIDLNMHVPPVFSEKPVYYKGCVIYSNDKNDFEGDEMFRVVDDLNLKCENNRYAYLTSYRFSDRVSLVICRNPLNDKIPSECYSLYYIEDMRK